MDWSHLPVPWQVDVFAAATTVSQATLGFLTWRKPRAAQQIALLCVGAGGVGGSGFTGASGTQRGGGGGGGSGGIARMMCAASMLPDTLFYQVGIGTLGGGIGTSTVIRTSGTGANIIQGSSGTSGGTGTATVGGAAGAAGGFASANWLRAFIATTSGQSGVIGGANSAGAGPTPLLMVSGGAGGGGVTTGNVTAEGGQIFANGGVEAIPGGLANGGKGQDGKTIWLPDSYLFTATGGTGGGSTGASGVGGAGGNGGIGCGGGGGGGGVTGGAGGRGGDGIVIIVSW